MNKKWNGYLTVEASFLMPMVLFLYMLVILCGFYLYNRCVISQDNYLLAFRGSRFTDAAENYGEVIYGETEETDPDESYLKSRMAKKASLYPFCRIQEQRVAYDKGRVSVSTTGYQGTLAVTKQAERLDLLAIVAMTRRQEGMGKKGAW